MFSPVKTGVLYDDIKLMVGVTTQPTSTIINDNVDFRVFLLIQKHQDILNNFKISRIDFYNCKLSNEGDLRSLVPMNHPTNQSLARVWVRDEIN